MSRRTRRWWLLALVVGSLGFLAGAWQPGAAQNTPGSLEQQLVDTYAPIVMIKTQEKACDDDGEQFRPVSVDILFGTDDVRLVKRGAGNERTDTEVKRNIQASDLYGLDESYYLDLPGNPRDPGCTYETWGKERIKELGLEPSLYGRVVTEPVSGKIVVQYWYYWVFNDFNNTHESDWEGIQLVFDAESVQQVLYEQLIPSAIAFAQHEGGEQARWDDDKVETDGLHIVSHPSAGSHADYYEAAVWLGWGENGSGFGCDFSDPPNEELPVSVILLPSDLPDANSEFAWLTYEGLWGERQSPSMFSGPTGPITKPRWDDSVGWGDEIRGNSLPVPIHPTIGPSVSQVFCGAAQFGSTIVRIFPIDPKIVGAVLGLAGIGVVVLAAMAWHTFAQAVRLYVRHGCFFITVGVIAFPLAWVGQQIENWLQKSVLSYIDPHIPTQFHTRSLYNFLFHTGVGGVQEIALACIISPAVIYATMELSRSENANWGRTWDHSIKRFPTVLAGSFYVALLLTLMTISVVLLPFVIYKAVQWFFTPEAIVIDKASWREGRHVSAARMQGHWIRALALVVAVGVVSGLPGPLIGTVGLILDWLHLERAQWISAAIYCVLYPLSIIMATLFYLRWSVAPGRAAPYVAPRPEPAAPTNAPATV